MRLLIDMDEVLANTNKEWLNRYNEDYKDNKVPEDMKSWNHHKWIKPECGKKIYKYLLDKGFFLSLEPIEGAIDGMNYLLSCEDLDVLIVTASPVESEYAVEDKKKWIRKYLPNFDLINFLPFKRKTIIEADLMFDDGPHNLKDFKGTSVMFLKEWNKMDAEGSADVVVSNWSQFIELINNIRNSSMVREMFVEISKERRGVL